MYCLVIGLVHTCTQNCELVSIDKVLRLFIDKMQVWTCWQKVPDQVGFVPQQSTDKIGDLSMDIRRFHPSMCTKLKARSAQCVVRVCDASWFAHRVYEEIYINWVDVSFVHSLHLVRQVGGKLTHFETNGSRISVILYLVQKIIYRNTSNIGLWRVQE